MRTADIIVGGYHVYKSGGPNTRYSDERVVKVLETKVVRQVRSGWGHRSTVHDGVMVEFIPPRRTWGKSYQDRDVVRPAEILRHIKDLIPWAHEQALHEEANRTARAERHAAQVKWREETAPALRRDLEALGIDGWVKAYPGPVEVDPRDLRFLLDLALAACDEE